MGCQMNFTNLMTYLYFKNFYLEQNIIDKRLQHYIEIKRNKELYTL